MIPTAANAYKLFLAVQPQTFAQLVILAKILLRLVDISQKFLSPPTFKMGAGGSHLISPGHPGMPDPRRQGWVVHHGRPGRQQHAGGFNPMMEQPYPPHPPMPWAAQPPMPGPMGPPGSRMPGWQRKRGNPPPGYSDWFGYDEAVDQFEDENMSGEMDMSMRAQRRKGMRQMQRDLGMRPHGRPF